MAVAASRRSERACRNVALQNSNKIQYLRYIHKPTLLFDAAPGAGARAGAVLVQLGCEYAIKMCGELSFLRVRF